MKNQIVVHNFRICFFGFSKNFIKVFTDGGSQNFLFWWGWGVGGGVLLVGGVHRILKGNLKLHSIPH